MEESVTLFVNGLEFYGYHGVPPEEQVIGHRYSIDLQITVRTAATKSDQVSDTVDYGALAVGLAKFCAEYRFATVERLADAAGTWMLETFPKIMTLRLRIAKLLPPAPIIAAAAGVEITRERTPRSLS
jgi:dihydroneopterin aldolase